MKKTVTLAKAEYDDMCYRLKNHQKVQKEAEDKAWWCGYGRGSWMTPFLLLCLWGIMVGIFQ